MQRRFLSWNASQKQLASQATAAMHGRLAQFRQAHRWDVSKHHDSCQRPRGRRLARVEILGAQRPVMTLTTAPWGSSAIGNAGAFPGDIGLRLATAAG